MTDRTPNLAWPPLHRTNGTTRRDRFGLDAVVKYL